jgi:hypothetical protein
MGALPTSQPACRHAPYLEELHEFFADHHLYFGIASDIIPLVERLQYPGPFRDEMSCVVQSIQAREGGSLPTAGLLEIVASAVGGPHIHQTSPQLDQPLSQLYDFVSSIAATPYPEAPERRAGEILSFPDKPRANALPDPEEAVVPDARSFSRPRRSLHVGAYAINLPQMPITGPSFLKMLIAAGIAVVVAVVLAVAMRPRSSSAHPVAVPAAGQGPVAHPAKPSAYGEAFTPTQPPPRHRARPKSSVDPSQPAGGASSAHPANAAR